MDEVWKEIPGFEGKYMASSSGKIMSLNFRGVSGRKGILKQSQDRYGYLKCSLYKNGKQMYFSVHRLVLLTFVPNAEGKPAINHINGNKKDNHVENLEWVTCSENTQHAYRNGLIPKTSERKRESSKNNIRIAIASNIGRKASDETRKRMSEARRGKPHSAEWVAHWKESKQRKKLEEII